MSAVESILISLEARHAKNILDGKKLVEFRRRSMNVKPGTTVWIYAKLPVGSIVGCATVTAICMQAPSTLWRKFGPVSGISRSEFFDYFAGKSQGTALQLKEGKRLSVSVSLERLRTVARDFQPPQFFAHLKRGAAVLDAISQTRLEGPE